MLGLLLLALVAICYGASLGAPLMFDDIPNLVDNPLMQFDPASLDGWRSATLSGEAGTLLRPLSMFSFAVNLGLEGSFEPVSLKAANLLVHLLCAVLVYRLAQLLFAALTQTEDARSANRLALLAAALWVLAPMHASTVLYAVQRMAQLSTVFVLLGLVVYSQYRQRWLRRIPAPGEVLALLLWGALLTCLAMLSKENGVLLPWLALVLEVTVFRGRFGGRQYPTIQGLAVGLLLLPVAAVLVAYTMAPGILTDGYHFRDFSLKERLLTQLRVLWHYVYWFVWPDIRNMGFQHDDIALSSGWLQPLTTLVAGVAWLLVLALAFWFRSRFPALLLGVLFFLVGHSLESSVLPLEMAFEHRNYLPTVGLALLASALLGWLSNRFPGIRPRVVIAPVVLILTLLLAVRGHIWSDQLRFARANAVNHPDSVRAQFFYADALYSRIGSEKAGPGASDGALLFAAREQFIQVNDMAGGHATALVMLYFADLFYLSELEDRPDWLQQLNATLLSGGRLTASDYSALESLVNCAVEGMCKVDSERILALMQQMLERNAGNFRLLEQHYKLTAVMGLEKDRRATLAQLKTIAPQVPALYSYSLAESGASASQAGAYTAMAGWLASDRLRKHLPMLRTVAEKASAQMAVVPAQPAGEGH